VRRQRLRNLRKFCSNDLNSSIRLETCLTLLGLLNDWTHLAPKPISVSFFVAAIIAGGWFVAPKAVSAIRRLSPDMNLLMTIAVLGAAGIGE